MSNRKALSAVFKQTKPIIGVLHLKGNGDAEVMERTKRELEIYINNGLDGVLVENYYGHFYQVEKVLDYIKSETIGIPYGVNCLNNDEMCMELAKDFSCDFLQLDSVVGHVKPRDEYTLDAFYKRRLKDFEPFVLGGVRFKYQPVLSENSLAEDLVIAQNRCDAVCVTQNATGEETSIDKIKDFRSHLGSFPLFVCAGLTPANLKEQLAIADGAVIGSYFKDTYKDTGDVCSAHVKEITSKINELRREIE